jgi:uncharacterized protein (TIGR02145 family)
LLEDIDDWKAIITPGYCWHGNDEATSWGALYNWHAVDTAILAPIGWHVPTNTEWLTLATYLGGYATAGTKLKEAGTSHWAEGNTGDNSSGFTALGAGARIFSSGGFVTNGDYTRLWSSTSFDTLNAWQRQLGYDLVQLDVGEYTKGSGLSVRCIKDN